MQHDALSRHCVEQAPVGDGDIKRFRLRRERGGFTDFRYDAGDGEDIFGVDDGTDEIDPQFPGRFELPAGQKVVSMLVSRRLLDIAADEDADLRGLGTRMGADFARIYAD
jgi:hypothetical protein